LARTLAFTVFGAAHLILTGPHRESKRGKRRQRLVSLRSVAHSRRAIRTQQGAVLLARSIRTSWLPRPRSHRSPIGCMSLTPTDPPAHIIANRHGGPRCQPDHKADSLCPTHNVHVGQGTRLSSVAVAQSGACCEWSYCRYPSRAVPSTFHVIPDGPHTPRRGGNRAMPFLFAADRQGAPGLQPCGRPMSQSAKTRPREPPRLCDEIRRRCGPSTDLLDVIPTDRSYRCQEPPLFDVALRPD